MYYRYVNKIKLEVKNMTRIETIVWKKKGGDRGVCLSQKQNFWESLSVTLNKTFKNSMVETSISVERSKNHE